MGGGAFTIGAALLGYDCLGLDYSEINTRVATERALICRTQSTHFEVVDVRRLDQRCDLISKFDVVICCEVIEHIIDDRKLVRDIAKCLKPGGRLLLTTPNYNLKAIAPGDYAPCSTVEDGGHVRRGYAEGDLIRLCNEAGLICDGISFCSGFLSQKVTSLLRASSKVHRLFSWVILPLRVFPPLFDPVVTRLLRWPYFSICLCAHRPEDTGDAQSLAGAGSALCRGST